MPSRPSAAKRREIISTGPPESYYKWERSNHQPSYTHRRAITKEFKKCTRCRNSKSTTVCMMYAKYVVGEKNEIHWKSGRCDPCHDGHESCDLALMTSDSLDAYEHGELHKPKKAPISERTLLCHKASSCPTVLPKSISGHQTNKQCQLSAYYDLESRMVGEQSETPARNQDIKLPQDLNSRYQEPAVYGSMQPIPSGNPWEQRVLELQPGSQNRTHPEGTAQESEQKIGEIHQKTGLSDADNETAHPVSEATGHTLFSDMVPPTYHDSQAFVWLPENFTGNSISTERDTDPISYPLSQIPLPEFEPWGESYENSDIPHHSTGQEYTSACLTQQASFNGLDEQTSQP